ncbi:MAG TPA: hypothetical protein VG267_06540 [Terracidiphilus sp.]|jgi:hypothetical protein|nr:hypothetical protein [Terracidiphilus sp.]
MVPSRRSFLQNAAILAVTTSASIRSLAAQKKVHELTTSEEIGLQTLASEPQETFEKWTGGKFRASLSGGSVGTLVLANVTSATYPRSDKHTGLPRGVEVLEVKATLLEFTSRSSYLPPNTYTLDHDWLGTFDLLVEPCLYPQGTFTYIAVFTRFTGKSGLT